MASATTTTDDLKSTNDASTFGGDAPSARAAEAQEPKSEYVIDEKITSEKEEKPTEYPQGLQLVLIMLTVLLTLFLAALDQTIVATAIPKITDDFGGLDKVSWYGSAYFMTFAGCLAAWGKALRYFSIKWTYLVALFFFEIGSLICGVAPNADVLITGRAIAGVGCAGLSTATIICVSMAAEPRKRPLLMSMVITTYGVAAVCGPLLGGAFTEHVSWRWCFYINLPIGAVCAVATFFSFHLPTIPTSATLKEKLLQLDLGGAALIMGAIVAFTLALQYGGQTMSWNSSTVIGLLVGFGLMIAALAAWEFWQNERAMVVPRLFRQRTIWVASTFQLFFAATYFITLYYLPIYFQSVLDVSASGSGVRNLPLVISIGIASVVGGVILSKTGRVMILMAVCSALATVTVGLFYTLDRESSDGAWIGFQILGGASWGAAWQCCLALGQSGQPPADLPVSSSIVMLLQTLSGALGLPIVQCMFNNTLIKHLASVAPHISPEKVLATGATDIRNAFSSEDAFEVIGAYLEALKVVWIATMAFGGAAFVMSLMAPRKSLFQDAKKGDEKDVPAMAV